MRGLITLFLPPCTVHTEEDFFCFPSDFLRLSLFSLDNIIFVLAKGSVCQSSLDKKELEKLQRFGFFKLWHYFSQDLRHPLPSFTILHSVFGQYTHPPPPLKATPSILVDCVAAPTFIYICITCLKVHYQSLVS